MIFIEIGVSFIYYKFLFFIEEFFFLIFIILKKDCGKRMLFLVLLSKLYVRYYLFELFLLSRK